MTRVIPVDQPLDLALSLEMGQAFRWRRVGDEKVHNHDWGEPPPPWRKDGGGWYSGVLGEHLVHLRQTVQGIEYRVGGEHGECYDVDMHRQLRSYFRLDDDLEQVYDLLGRDSMVAWAIALYPGLRLLRQEPWECLASYICSATNSVHGIQASIEKIVQLSRKKVKLGEEERYLFPTAQDVVDAGRETMAGLRLGLDRHRNLGQMAIRLVHDPTMLENLAQPSVPAREAVTLLDSYRGIGPKMASCVALMSLDKLDAFPVDRWVQRALVQCDLSAMEARLAERVGSLRRLTERQQYRVAQWASENFGEYAGYASQFLFHWIEPVKERAIGNGGQGDAQAPARRWRGFRANPQMCPNG